MRYSIHCRFCCMTPDIFISGWRCIISDQIFLAVESSRDTIHIYTSDDKIRWFYFVWKLTPVFWWSNHQLESNILSVKAFSVWFFIQVLVGYLDFWHSQWWDPYLVDFHRHNPPERAMARCLAGLLVALQLVAAKRLCPSGCKCSKGCGLGGDARLKLKFKWGFLTWMIIINNNHSTYDPFLDWI